MIHKLVQVHSRCYERVDEAENQDEIWSVSPLQPKTTRNPPTAEQVRLPCSGREHTAQETASERV